MVTSYFLAHFCSNVASAVRRRPLSCINFHILCSLTTHRTSDVMFRVMVSVLTVAQSDCRLIEIGNVAQATGGHVCHISSFNSLIFSCHLFDALLCARRQ